MHPILESLREIMPENLTRKQVKEYLGNLISIKYLANLDSQGKGPKVSRFGGRKVIYL